MTDPAPGPATARAGRLPPLPIMVSGFIMAVVAIVLAGLTATHPPWLGAEFRATDNGQVEVTHVWPRSPASKQLVEGQTLVAIEDATGQAVSLIGFDPHLEPHNHATFDSFHAYLQRHDEIATALRGESVTLVTADGDRLTITPAKDRPLASLPADFWLLNLFGLPPLLIGLAVWVFRPKLTAARLLAFSGVGFFAATCLHSVFISRELALPAAPFELMLRFNHYGLSLLLGSLMALMAYYPRRLSRYPAGILVLILMLAYQLNETFYWWQWPGHAFYTPILLLYLIGIGVAIWQWQLAQRQPLDRAALKWVFLSIFLAMGISLMLYFAPVAIGESPILGAAGMVGVASTVYIGFALGILRYRLFDLERWWFTAWMWFFAGVVILLVDAALVLVLGLQPVQALGIAVIAVGWLYFPARQWLWQSLARCPQDSVEQFLPRLTRMMLEACSPRSSSERWQAFLTSLHQPLDIALRQDEPGDGPAQIRQNGASLRVALPEQSGYLELFHAGNGRRLFSPQDAETADALLAVARQICQARNAEAEGARTERRRIMRDLHDDVGGHLLSLLHGATDGATREQARVALQALRESIHALDEGRTHHLEDALEDWQTELAERCDYSGTRLDWVQCCADTLDITLSARQYINLKRILSEAATNALRHARPETLRVRVDAEAERLRIVIRNPANVTGASERRPLAGRGMHNMRTRTGELGGHIRFQPPGSTCGEYTVELDIPLHRKPAAQTAGMTV
ncbi:MAG: hypothetical protein JJT90_12755 [Ectothiorhodospiraceae bacterium]|nr:hypothetical protein [Ectothiorhodospiraceae bacterium]